MNNYLKSASKRFTDIKKSDYLINPISEIDCEIIIELSELFKKLGAGHISEILKQYKCLKDEEIRDQLMQANIDFNQKETEVENKKVSKKNLFKQLLELFDLFRTFLIIGDERIDTKFIFGYKKDFKLKDDIEEYYIILNPLDTENMKSLPYYTNHKFTFYDVNKRDDMVKILDKILQDNDVKFANDEER